ncbi:MAG TPA: sensor histidine kinase [Solirubrobacteraceae bacterium]|nr:sensor histidine kinase [Solirubrobacteraceae bacterium]
MAQTATHEFFPAAAGKVALVEDSFRHEALFYRGMDGFLDGTLPFICEALEAGEAVLVAVGEAQAERLADALGDEAQAVRFLGTEDLGRNPGRLIPTWSRLVSALAADGRSVRAIGEAVRPGCSAAEFEECRRHEALLDEAFAGGPSWRLLCPYDVDGLDAETIAAARSIHRTVMHEGTSRRNGAFRHRAPGPFDGTLPSPPSDREELAFTARGLGAVRSLVARHGERAGLPRSSTEDLVLAVNELVTNSVQYGGGGGTLRVWRSPGALVCEAHDRGLIRDPLAGRVRPPVDQYGGRGLWLVNHLCDLVQIRSSLDGTAVRVHMLV